MRALLLYDEASEDFEGVNLAKQVETTIINAGTEVKLRKIEGEDFKQCIGCFGCWIKTPGLCVLPGDEANNINCDVVNSQTLVILTNVLYGGYSADIKKYIDRIIPIISPFFATVDGEMHHQKRYDSYPNFVVIGYGSKISAKEKDTFKMLVKRNSINIYAPKNISLIIENKSDVEKGMIALSDFLVEVLS